MIYTFGNVKGGVGKSTLAVNFAIGRARARRDVLLVDGDEQKTALAFYDLRTEQKGDDGAGYTCIALQGASLRTQVRQKFAPKYDDIIIDVGGRDTGSFRAALTVTNVVVIPVQPRSFDLWSIDQTADLVTEAREVNDQLRAIAVVNEADPFGKDNQKALDYIREIQGLELAPVLIVRRKAFPNAAAAGLSVLEYDDTKAAEELTQLMDFILVNTNAIRELSYGNR
jgi:chromosome partitioning protein